MNDSFTYVPLYERIQKQKEEARERREEKERKEEEKREKERRENEELEKGINNGTIVSIPIHKYLACGGDPLKLEKVMEEYRKK